MDQHSIDMENGDLQNEIEIEESSDENRMSRADDIQQRISCGDIQQRITHGIRCLDPLPYEACIFRVHQELRQVNEKAYTPMLVSIGPYHHGKPEYKAREEHKRRYLDSVLKRTKKSVEYYIDTIINLESRARNYYANAFDLGREKSFVEVMLLDGCFVVEFLHRRLIKEYRDNDDPIFNQLWMEYQIYRDLMLLENQLPFFVLSELGNISGLLPLHLLVLHPVIWIFPPAEYFGNDLLSKCDESKHFLDLVHNVCRPSTAPNDESSPNSSSEVTSWNMSCAEEVGEAGVNLKSDEDGARVNVNEVTCWNMSCVTKRGEDGEQLKADKDSAKVKVNEETRGNMPCVTELGKAGVKFQANSGDIGKVNMFDLKFDWNFRFQRVLKIPKFDLKFEWNLRFQRVLKIQKLRVSDSTETFFRNIIAYEQHSPEAKTQYFTEYMDIMDYLINSKDDVKELCRHNIIDNLLGDEEVLARMFNKLGDGVIVPQEHYSKLYKEVNVHCNRWWNKAKAKLKRDYFNSPWAGVSTIAAIILLLLTLLQTLASLKLI